MGRGVGRRELRRQDYARRGLVVLVAFALLLIAAWLRMSGAVGGDPEVSAQLRNAGGSLRNGSDVKIAGVIVGRVTGIARGEDGGVRVDMSLPEGELDSIPDNVVARILPATVFGTSFVDLVVYDGASDRSLEAGAVIPADQTQDTLELQQALDDIDRLVKALGPAELASAISSAAQALDGRGAQLGEIVDTLTAYLGRLNPQMPLVRSDLRKLATNLEVVDDVAPDLLDATEDGLVTLETIVTQQAAIRAIIVGGTSLTSTATAFLNENRAEAVRVINDGAILLDALYDNRRSGISGSIATNVALGAELPTILDHGFALTDAQMRTDAPPYYTADDRPRLSRAGLSGLFRGGR
ncbi:MAG TPA: MCE family protein [Nocardioides sp.]|nr:MCE family protein [Nocardioides sp.]